MVRRKTEQSSESCLKLIRVLKFWYLLITYDLAEIFDAFLDNFCIEFDHECNSIHKKKKGRRLCVGFLMISFEF